MNILFFELIGFYLHKKLNLKIVVLEIQSNI